MSTLSQQLWIRASPTSDEMLEPSERDWTELLDERCSGDAELRRQVPQLHFSSI
jgi:hypothetical protein